MINGDLLAKLKGAKRMHNQRARNSARHASISSSVRVRSSSRAVTSGTRTGLRLCVVWTAPVYHLPTDTSATTLSRAESHRRLSAQNSATLPSEIDYARAGAVITVFILVPDDGLEDARGYPVLATVTPQQRQALARELSSPKKTIRIVPNVDKGTWQARLFGQWCKVGDTLDVMLTKLNDKFSVIAWIR